MFLYFSSKIMQKWGKETNCMSLLFYEKALYEVKPSGQALTLKIFW